MIKRYHYGSDCDGVWFEEDDDGALVYYEDHAREIGALRTKAARWDWIMEGYYGEDPTRNNRVIGQCWNRVATEKAIDADIAAHTPALQEGE